MVLENFASSLRDTIRKISGSSIIDRETIKEVVKDIQRILLKADVNVKLALKLSKDLEARATGEKPPAGMAPQDFIVKLIYEELLSLLGKGSTLTLKPQTIMLVGLYGQGKTTSAGKLAKFFMRKGMSVGLIAADVHRPAAYDQLYQISKAVNCAFYGEKNSKDPVKICRSGLKELKDIQVKIVDTSGRDSLDEELLKEISHVRDAVNPDEVLYVLDAGVGQQAGPQASRINENVRITGVIITKMDGTGKGGGALSAVSEAKVPIYFIGTGEHLDDMEIFDPKKFLSRLLGLGDLESLLEIAREAEIKEEDAEESMAKLMSGKFNLMDMYEVWEKFSRPGIMRKIFDSLPVARMGGMAKMDGNVVETAEQKLKLYSTILDSMTRQEMTDPDIINTKRIERIARGSGTTEEQVRSLLKEYRAMKKNFKNLQGDRNFKKMLRSQLRSGDFSLENIAK
ncbi:MAG: signal recognition particle protein Srp54 [Candidatus Thermoplasmatota archaeon]|nr:signal recognition particle protein Srp54 [Candidatus Thermoplasmatota archaeon]MCL5665899.1 signal recognition particle protein Srp54 [Candidatus Thermoplasmatota archaeon]